METCCGLGTAPEKSQWWFPALFRARVERYCGRPRMWQPLGALTLVLRAIRGPQCRHPSRNVCCGWGRGGARLPAGPLNKSEESAQCSTQGRAVHLRRRLMAAVRRPLSLGLAEYQPHSLSRAECSGPRACTLRIKSAFAYRLGPSHVQRNALLAQPFLASVP